MSNYDDPPSPNPNCTRCEGTGKYWPLSYRPREEVCRCGPAPLPATPEMKAERERLARIIERAAMNLEGLPAAREALLSIVSAVQDPDDNGWAGY